MNYYWYRFQQRFRSRFPYRLTIHTLRSGPDWDKGSTVLHAAFQLLVDYIEKECVEFPIAYDFNPHLKVARDEMDVLYHWWKVERPTRTTLDDRLSGIPEPSIEECMEVDEQGRTTFVSREERYPEYYAILRGESAIETAYYEEDQQYLKRLIDVREFMWT